jgi:hypothetical protein
MSSLNSSEMEDQLAMAFQGIMEKAVAAAASLSTRGSKHR